MPDDTKFDKNINELLSLNIDDLSLSVRTSRAYPVVTDNRNILQFSGGRWGSTS